MIPYFASTGGIVWTPAPAPDCGSTAISTTKYPCSFCAEPTDHSRNKDWHVCVRPTCQMASAAQAERVYAGLIDCPETRRDALAWAKRKADQ